MPKLTAKSAEKTYARINVWKSTKKRLVIAINKRNRGKKGKDRETLALYVDNLSKI